MGGALDECLALARQKDIPTILAMQSFIAANEGLLMVCFVIIILGLIVQPLVVVVLWGYARRLSAQTEDLRKHAASIESSLAGLRRSIDENASKANLQLQQLNDTLGDAQVDRVPTTVQG